MSGEKAKCIGDKIWQGVKSFKQIGRQTVYNLEVEGDNSYTANNIIVHNCQAFSFSGKMKGMSTKQGEEVYTIERYLELKREGFQFEGQSYLFWEYMRILNEVRKYNPNVFFLLENEDVREVGALPVPCYRCTWSAYQLCSCVGTTKKAYLLEQYPNKASQW